VHVFFRIDRNPKITHFNARVRCMYETDGRNGTCALCNYTVENVQVRNYHDNVRFVSVIYSYINVNHYFRETSSVGSDRRVDRRYLLATKFVWKTKNEYFSRRKNETIRLRYRYNAANRSDFFVSSRDTIY